MPSAETRQKYAAATAAARATPEPPKRRNPRRKVADIAVPRDGVPVSTITHTPLRNLRHSPLNVRKTNLDAEIPELAASIRAHGLKQNLDVVQADDGRFEVVAGGRRLRALHQLLDDDAIDIDFPVPILIVPREDGRETSLDENLIRMPMNPADEVEAFAAIVEKRADVAGGPIAYCAARYGCTERHVEERLRLAALAPRILDALRDGKIGLSSARAYVTFGEHSLQLKVFEEEERRGLGERHRPDNVRDRLKGTVTRADSAQALYVGLEAYCQAGGRIERSFDLADGETDVLTELKLQKKADFPYRFDADKAARICKFVERMPHSKGKWARKKETLRLEPWQVWILCCAYGWLHKAGNRAGTRRFRILFVIVPRKNGKSALAAPIGLYMFCADGEFGAEVYSGATNEKQAWEVFKPAKLMASRTPALLAKFGIKVNAASLVRVDDESKFETIVGDPGDGQSPSCAIHDEYHEHADDGQVDTMQTGMGARDQPMQVLITTAGDNLAGPCYARVQEEREKLAGIGHNGGPPLEDETFFVEFTIDEGDDWKSEAALRKANPNFDVSVSGDFLRARQRDAIATPRKAGVFKTKHLNLWVAAKAAYFDIEAWRRCRDVNMPTKAAEAVKLEQLRGRRCIASLDLASKVDIAALELLFPPIGDKATVDDPYIRIGFYFVPSETVLNVAAYQAWDAQGLLNVTDGNIIDYDEILEVLREVRSLFQLETVAYDPHQATYMVTTMVKEGFPVIEYRPIVINFSEPMKELDALMKAGTIAHGGCPVMEWEVANVVAQPDAKDNVYPRKPRDEAKIDNPVALMAALGVAMPKVEEEMQASPWDDPEFDMIGEGAE